MLFDAHAHYDDRRFEAEFDGGFRGAIAKAIDEGVGHIVNVGSSVRTSKNSVSLAEEYPFIYAAVGYSSVRRSGDTRRRLRQSTVRDRKAVCA